MQSLENINIFLLLAVRAANSWNPLRNISSTMKWVLTQIHNHIDYAEVGQVRIATSVI